MINYTNQYSVNFIHGEQSRASTAIQCTSLLQYLENVMDDIFNNILIRINDNSDRVQELHNRVKIAEAKIEKLKDRENATQVFSSAVYPGEDDYKSFKCFVNKPKLQHMQYGYNVHESESPEYDSSLIKEKLDFFHVQDYRRRHSHSRNSNHREGLGRLPPHLSSVSSLLLYNTTHNPYKEYMLLDPLGVISGTRGDSKCDIEGNVNLHEAPVSIKGGDNVVQLTKDEFQYLPDLSDLPALDLPMELPFLSGIANDLMYEAGEGPSIAPSLGIPELPVFESISSTVHSEPPVPPSPVNGSKLFSLEDSSASLSFSASEQTLASKVTSEVDEIPPPPPPPPPPTFTHMIQKQEESKSTASARNFEGIPKEAASNSRFNLMKAIQEAGGAGKANLKKVGSKKQESLSNASGGNDLMSDLFAKLSQRRKGISGNVSVTKDMKRDSPENESEEVKESRSTMQKMSVFIPPPSVAHDTDSDYPPSDDDWE